MLIHWYGTLIVGTSIECIAHPSLSCKKANDGSVHTERSVSSLCTRGVFPFASCADITGSSGAWDWTVILWNNLSLGSVLAISASNITAPPSVCLPRLFTLISPYSFLELSQVKNTHRHTLDKGAKIHFGHILDHVTNVPASNEVLNKHTLSHRSFHARIAHKTNEWTGMRSMSGRINSLGIGRNILLLKAHCA